VITGGVNLCRSLQVADAESFSSLQQKRNALGSNRTFFGEISRNLNHQVLGLVALEEISQPIPLISEKYDTALIEGEIQTMITEMDSKKKFKSL
jgi:hypothetical protein